MQSKLYLHYNNINILYNISNTLKKIVINEIKNNNGWISFYHYMKLVLYFKNLGYYKNNYINIGKNGNFTTSSEISSIFGKTFAFFVKELFKQTKNVIMEIGAGTGKFAFDLLNKLHSIKIKVKKYYIYEISNTLCNIQKKKLLNFKNIIWINNLPKSFSGIIIANEVLDSIPFNLIIKSNLGWLERGVSIDINNNFIYFDKFLNSKKKYYKIFNYHLLPIGYITETHSKSIKFINSIIKMLSLGKNISIFIDYGFSSKEYYLNTRYNGTLMCHFNHYSHFNPFYLPGLQDITSHVNFTDIANAIIKGGLKILSYHNQSSFLLNIGILKILSNINKINYLKYFSYVNAIQKMLSITEMGELFKVLIFGKDVYLPKKYCLYDIKYKL